MQSEDRRLKKGLPLRANDQSAIHDEDVVGVHLEVLSIKLERPLHDEHVDADVGVKQDMLAHLGGREVLGGVGLGRGVAAGVEAEDGSYS